MTLKITKQHLIQLLADPDIKVIALSGKWGTGKSHLWREVKDSSQDEKIKAALYVSLFGLASMDQVKLKLVQSAVPAAESNPSLWETTKQTIKSVAKALEGFHKSFSALNEFALLVVPSILRNKVIVLDDIERKHSKLSVDEVMGFIDEFTQQYGARIVLILNSDQLADHPLWDTLREKVIDQELRLDTSPAEAFEIALGLVPSPYADRIKKTVETCGLTNIRIICKVLRALNRILGNRKDLSDEILARVVPSTVLLAAIHYKGIEGDGPDLNFVLKIGNPDEWGDWGKKAEELDEDGRRRAKWRLMLQELGIHGCDEYEQLVVEFLKSGLFDVSEVSRIIERYVCEADAMSAQHLAREFHEHVIWHYRMTEEELLAEARSLADKSHLLDAFTVTGLYDHVLNLNGGGPVADLIVNNWIAAFRKRDVQNVSFENFFQQPIRPRIEAEFNAAKAAAKAKITVFEACKHIAKNNGWGHKQEAVMRAAMPRDFEATIKSLDADDLKLFMLRFLDMCVHRSTYQAHFGSATDHFIEACGNIYSDPGSGRLGGLIKLLFKDAKLESELVRRCSSAAEPVGTTQASNSSVDDSAG